MIVIAGPCSAESQQQILSTAKTLSEGGIHMLRAGLWKPRTHPGSFEGVGAEGLGWLTLAQKEFGMSAGTEVACAEHVRACADAGLGFVWIGARTTVNPFLMDEIAHALEGTGMQVLVKNPASPDLGLWEGAVERLLDCGVKDICLVHRGFPHFSGTASPYRNAPHWGAAFEMKSKFPGLPLLCDPSHIAGRSDLVAEVSRRAVDLGFEGLMAECHPSPSEALSDAAQQVTPDELVALVHSLSSRTSLPSGTNASIELQQLRESIDRLDDRLVDTLSRRLEACRQIGRLKQQKDIAIVQPTRWEQVLLRVCAQAKAQGLDEEFTKALFNLIHEESIRSQK